MREARNLLLKPPMNVLIDPEAIRGQKPWELDLSQLLEALLKIRGKSEDIDLRLCGSAALSSAIIYRLKVETLFLFERLKVERRIGASEEPPQVILLPFRYELSTTSLEELLLALERIIQEISSESESRRGKNVTAILVESDESIKLDTFITHIREILSIFRHQLIEKLTTQGSVFFRDLVKDLSLLEEVRAFIMLLFIATERLVELEQIGDEIKISLVQNLADGE